MNMLLSPRPVTIALALVLAVGISDGSAVARDAPDLKVMSYNIRYGTAPDGENHWDRRKAFLAETVNAANPDLLGTQETLPDQRTYLAEQFPTYGVFAAGRDDGKESGEMMAVYWRKERFEKLDGGHFWLSETPDKPGSKSWDSVFPRLVTWVKLRDLKAREAKPILWLNTHFDHRGKQARLEAARIVRAKLATLGKDCSLIVTGDFNSAEGSDPYKALFDALGDQKSPVVDTFRVAHPQRGADEGTASGFKAAATKGNRIDWIACSRDWTVRKSDIDRTARDGRTPSDHFAVTAVLAR
jgi:endonuclease/exonuclease/phosphatase family metal-dependent hydrolase